MVTLLEFIFQGFFEWVYSLILDIWNYFTSSLLGVMSLDFAYLKTHIPIMGDIQQILLAVGWALLLGNLVFQALRSMASGLGFEGEDPKLLFARTFVFGFLLLASPQICETVLGMTSKVIALLEVPDAINVQLVDGSVIGVFTASWILVIIFDLITMFMVLSLLLEVAERYMVLAMLTITAPLAFAMGGSKSTSEIFAGWCRMFGSMCLLMATNIVFFKMLLSVVSTVPSFPDVFLWMVLIISIVKVAKKADEIITRIGLNPAITGNKSSLPGVIAYTVFRTALSMVTKGAADGISGALGLTGKATGVGKSAGTGKGVAGTAFKGRGKVPQGTASTAAGAPTGGIGSVAAQAAGGPRYGGGRTQSSHADSQQEHTQHTQHDTVQSQTGSQRQTASQGHETVGHGREPGSILQPDRPSRRTFVQSGIHLAPSSVTPPGSQSKTGEKSSSSGFIGFYGPQSGGFTGSDPSRGGGIGGADIKTDTSRGGTFGGRPSGTARGTGFNSTSSRVSQKMEISQSGTAGTGTSLPAGKPGDSAPGPQPGIAGMDTRSTQRPPAARPQHSKNTPPSPAAPPAAKMSALDAPGPQSGTAGMGTRSTQRPSVPAPRHVGNTPPSPAAPPSGAQSSSPAQQEPRRASGKDKPPVKSGGSIPSPGTAGTVPGSRTPPGQKLGGGPTLQKAMRQTKRKGGPTSV